MLTDVQLTSRSEWYAASYSLCGTVYETVFAVHQFGVMQCETRELVQVEEDGRAVSDDCLWMKIAKAVDDEVLEDKCKHIRFSVELDANWQGILEEFIDQVLASAPCSPTEALEFEIFSQIRKEVR